MSENTAIESKILVLYENVAEITEQMLLAAKSQNWDKLAELELSCAEYIENARIHDSAERLTGVQLSKKIRTIKQILATDREIRSLVDPWMDKLSMIIKRDDPDQPFANLSGQTAH